MTDLTGVSSTRWDIRLQIRRISRTCPGYSGTRSEVDTHDNKEQLEVQTTLQNVSK
jgi:hypothetical protein